MLKRKGRLRERQRADTREEKVDWKDSGCQLAVFKHGRAHMHTPVPGESASPAEMEVQHVSHSLAAVITPKKHGAGGS